MQGGADDVVSDLRFSSIRVPAAGLWLLMALTAAQEQGRVN